MQNHTLAVARRGSPGEPVKMSDQVIVKESDSSLAKEGTNVKLAHDHWTGPWQVTWVVQPGLRIDISLNGRRSRGCRIPKRTVSAANIKKLQARPERLRHDLEDKISLFVWREDLRLAIVPISGDAAVRAGGP